MLHDTPPPSRSTAATSRRSAHRATCHPRSWSAWLLALLALAFAPAPAGAESAEDLAERIRSTYTKYEVRIPMRDGARLFTAIYVPNDRSRTYPILMNRTPYSVRPYGADRYKTRLGPSGLFVDEGFIFVYQDVRGKYMSEGKFVNMRPHQPVKNGPDDYDESSDTYDTIEWLLANVEGHNGRVGQWGISYPGFYSSAGMIDSHPALKAVSPQAPIADWFWDDVHRHGAFVLPLAFNFFSSFGVPRPEPTTESAERFDHGTADGYQFFLDLGPLKNVNEKYLEGEIPFWNEIVAHPNYDAFWQARNILPHLKNIRAAVMVVGGWFDTEDLYGPLKTYKAVEENNPDAFNVLVMGPWSHGAWSRTDGDRLGEADFGFKTAIAYRREVELAFFKHFLAGGPKPELPEARVFETGANRWRSFDAWPPAEAASAKLHLQADGGLSFDAAVEPSGSAFDSYPSDPAKPVPYTMEITTWWARNYMTEDQRFAAWRPDVLVYRSAPLEEDVTLAGPLLADLWVATSGTASDWVVKVIDEFPGEVPGWSRDSGEPNLGGTQRLVRAEAFRGRFRDSYEEPKPFVPNEVDQVSFELQDVLHTFKRGHRIMVQIQSSWFPFIDRNPQTYVPNIFEAEESDFVPVINRVYRSPEYPSGIEVKVLKAPG